jgi:hypothetical protein
MNEPAQAHFEDWAIVEIMGHQRHIGFVTTQVFGAAVLFRIDTPGLEAREWILTAPTRINFAWTPAGAKVQRPATPASSVLVGPSTIYRMTPCTEEAARQAIENLESRPLILLELPEGKQLPAAAAAPALYACAACGSFDCECLQNSEDDGTDL